MTVSIPKAARQLHRTPSTIRRWLAQGAPCERPGRSKKGQGALVDPEKLEQWYAAQHQLPSVRERPASAHMDQVSLWLWDALKRDSSGIGMPIHEALGIPEQKAAEFYVLLHRYLYLRFFDKPPTEAELPEPLLRLLSIARIGAHGGTVRKI